ncbi:MAG TPA: ABC transporter permease [Thermoplasmata archaeon]|nr:ABC transporter permease [Thermoplasmata archaeon]
MRGTSLAGRAIAGALSASLIALFVLPLVALFLYSGWGGLAFAVGSAGFRTTIEFTLLASGLAVALGLLTGIPLGYALARFQFPGKAVVQSIVTIPVVVPHLIVGIALLLLFAPTGPVGAFVASAGIPVFDAIWGVVLVMLYVGSSYVVLTSELAFRSVDEEVLEAARSLGAGPGEAFATVTLPTAARGILTGALLMWARGVSEVGGFLVLAYTVYPSPPWGGPPTQPSSIWIYNYWGINPVDAAGASALLVLVALAIFLIVRLVDRSGLGWARGGWFS